MTNDKNWFERLVDRAAGLGEHDSHWNNMSEQEKDELRKYAKDPNKYIDDARQGIYQRYAEHREKVTRSDYDDTYDAKQYGAEDDDE